MNMRRWLAVWLACLWVLWLVPARAQMTIDITGGAATRIPVAISPFAGAGQDYRTVTDVLAADLLRTGEISMVDVSDIAPPIAEPNDPRFGMARARGADAIVLGHVLPQPDGRLEVRFRLMDAVQQTQLAGYSYTVRPDQLRMVGHHIADIVYEKLTGVPGVFSTHIAYIIQQGSQYRIEIADSDGQNPQTVLKSKEALMSPAWSPDGKYMAYVSFETGRAIVYEQALDTGKRFVLAAFPGSNSAPAWSPDGKRIALVLTRDDGSQLYVMNADGSHLKRLTFGGGIDTEPCWSPDSKTLLFTSARDGTPQVYMMPSDGGNATRLTFDGSYNVSPRWSPDGKSFVFVQRMHGQFHIAVMDMASGQAQVLSSGIDDESPSYAPNGKMILYAAEVNGRGELAVVSSDGETHERLSNAAGLMEQPIWGP
ncbi:MAG: Tol-Pal system beta propeller repeat protein TolB [Betaproteobacteria bacterium]|nr:Tol-Pal system beta propeller repeat protein TolB [Betaproteobacteria bacterium]